MKTGARRTILAMAVCMPLPLYAVALTESERSSAVVRYENGNRIEALCEKQGRCSLAVSVAGREYSIEENSLGSDIVILPSNLALTVSDGPAGNGSKRDDLYGMEFEIRCDEYAERSPVYICLASVSMQGSQVITVMTGRRYFEDRWLPSDNEGTEEIDPRP